MTKYRRNQRGHMGSGWAELVGWTITLAGLVLAGGGVWLLIIGIRMLV